MFTAPLPTHFFQTAKSFPQLFQARHQDSHKGSHGTLAIIGGAAGMSGAVVLAATAAIYQGCGKVWAGFNQTALPMPIIADRPEIMLACAPDLLARSDISTWAIGCGMGLNSQAKILLKQALQQHAPLLIDADGLTLLAHTPEYTPLAQQHGQLVLTPHPAEAARLLACSTAQVQQNRPAAARAMAEKYHAHVVLKGHQSLVCTPQGELYTNHSGNAGLATAGSGDVLSGIIGSLLAQGLPLDQATRGGVWLHGAAADVLKLNQIGEIGMLSSEVPAAARWLRNRLIEAI